MQRSLIFKIITFALLVTLIALFWVFRLDRFFTLDNLKISREALRQYYQIRPVFVIASYFTVYVVSTALSLPGATILTLAGGAIFGLWTGTLIVSIASTLGATAAFLMSRFLLHDFVQKRFADKLASFNAGVKKDGVFYLFSLRLVPVFPFFLINLVMGLTAIPVKTFFFISQLGMLAGTFAYVNAGTRLSKIDSLKGILSFEVLSAFAFIGILPLLSKFMIDFYRSQKVLRHFQRPKIFEYNVVVIGAGSAGLVASYFASAVKAKVALVEKHRMGGDCLNTGCVPSKALIRSAKIVSNIRHATDFGLNEIKPEFDFARIMERVQRVVRTVAPHDSTERYSKLGVECFQGDAKIISPYEVKVGEEILTARNIIVATGASPLVPPIPGLNDITYLTSDTIWNLRQLPKKFLILGGGPIGCELAQAFARFGSEVHIVEMAPRLMIREDADVSEHITQRFTNDGITVHVGTKAKGVRRDGETKYLLCEKNGNETRIEFDEILLALGRKANVSGFGLAELGVEISTRGTIDHDEFLRTNYPNIYVCGDVAGPYQFTHTAAHQAWYAMVNALFAPFKKFKVDYRVIPWCTFTDPEVARVGVNEQEAKEKGIACQVSKYAIDDLDRAIAEDQAYGFVKVLTILGTDKILGVTIVGPHAGDIIAEYVVAMKHGIGMNKILGTIHIYPTFAEANKYVAGVWKRANAPQFALNMLARFHAWRRGNAKGIV
ncbi:MAG: pyridine nucleotide-disulfide oxidoreductase [Bdellovibrionales bacterium GWA2_49_15]|nr:MAG: pyridine nucleotide-disulfide oxidoreductase [Bdellovibrionales bacterium GWA2_49_15]HAZ14687.1 pyridine nucleotide-disulfide oxidoreductase [Bdellovibrionales bacterium]